MPQPDANNKEPNMPTRQKTMPALAIVAAVLGGLTVWPASPAAAAEITYENVPCENVHETGTFENERTWTMSAQGPSEPVAPGETFTLSDLVVTEHRGLNNHEGELTVLDGQVIDLGFSEHTPDDFHEWVVGDVELTAPTELGTHGINPEATWDRSPTSGESFLGTFCPRDGESFPDDPFATVEVADIDPTTTTTTTTTTVPGNGGGNGGNGDGDDVNGDDPEGDEETDAELDAEFEAEVDALEAETALLVGATPRFTG